MGPLPAIRAACLHAGTLGRLTARSFGTGARPSIPPPLGGYEGEVYSTLLSRRAAFPPEIALNSRLLSTQAEIGLAELTGSGLATADSFAALRGLIVPLSRRLRQAPTVGRWSLLRRDPLAASPEFVARQLLRRMGVVFRKTIERERVPMPWWRLVRELRTLETRDGGSVHERPTPLSGHADSGV